MSQSETHGERKQKQKKRCAIYSKLAHHGTHGHYALQFNRSLPQGLMLQGRNMLIKVPDSNLQSLAPAEIAPLL